MQVDAAGTATMIDLTGLEQGQNLRIGTIQLDAQVGSNLTLVISSSTNVLRKTGTSTIDAFTPPAGSTTGKFFFIKHTAGGGTTTTINHDAGSNGIICPGSAPFVIGAGGGGLDLHQALIMWNSDVSRWTLFPRGHTRSENIGWEGTYVFGKDTFFVGTQHNSGSTRNAATVTNLTDTFTAGTMHNSGTFRGVRGELSQNLGVQGTTNLVGRLFVSGTQVNGVDSFQTGTAHMSGALIVNNANGITGSMTRTPNGSSYIVPGSGITVTSGSGANGQITISSPLAASSEQLVQCILANTASSNSSTQLSFGQYNIPANSLVPSSTFRCTGYAIHTHAGGLTTPDLNVDFYYGGNLVESLFIDLPTTNQTTAIKVEGLFTCRTIGGSGTGMFAMMVSAPGANTLINAITGSTSTSTDTINTTTNSFLEMKIRMTTTGASNTLTVTHGFTEKLF